MYPYIPFYRPNLPKFYGRSSKAKTKPPKPEVKEELPPGVKSAKDFFIEDELEPLMAKENISREVALKKCEEIFKYLLTNNELKKYEELEKQELEKYKK